MGPTARALGMRVAGTRWDMHASIACLQGQQGHSVTPAGCKRAAAHFFERGIAVEGLSDAGVAGLPIAPQLIVWGRRPASSPLGRRASADIASPHHPTLLSRTWSEQSLSTMSLPGGRQAAGRAAA
jgi:hypothetical protein